MAQSLGFTNADIERVNNDNQVFQYLAAIDGQIKAFEEAVRLFRINLTEGDIGDQTPRFPANTNFNLPAGVDTGMFERLDKLRTKIMAADPYTNEIGALLDILPSSGGEPISDDKLKPKVTVTPQFSSYKFTVHATRMGKSSYKVQIRRMDSEAWTDAGISTTSDMEIQIEPRTPGQPERLQARVILMHKNQPVGQPSDAVYVTVNP